MSEKRKNIGDRTASKFRNTYYTVKEIRKRQSSKSYDVIPLILLLILGFYNVFVLNLFGIDSSDVTQRMHPAMILYFVILAVAVIMSCIYARDKMYNYSLSELLADEKDTDKDYSYTGMIMFIVGLYAILEYADIFSEWKPNTIFLFRLALVAIPIGLYFIFRHFVYSKCSDWLEKEKKYRKVFELSEEEFKQRYVEIVAANRDKDIWPVIDLFRYWRRLKVAGESRPWYLERWYGELTNEYMQFLDWLINEGEKEC